MCWRFCMDWTRAQSVLYLHLNEAGKLIYSLHPPPPYPCFNISRSHTVTDSSLPLLLSSSAAECTPLPLSLSSSLPLLLSSSAAECTPLPLSLSSSLPLLPLSLCLPP